ncbi:MAG: DUF1624 domain-containing protein [Clostridia bacterium]|nr:DUF1624 domain-containing protein [Clostridia bacterium]
MEGKKVRIWEIDFLRGIAIILMSIFHLLYDLSEFYDYDIDYNSGIVDIMGFSSALMFITLTAISSSFSRNNFKRAVKILFFAYCITGITYVYDSSTYINFGILHLIGFSILLYHFFNKFSSPVLILLGVLIIITGHYFDSFTVNTNLLTPFGLTGPNYKSLDYYPLFPYFGVFLLGMALKNIFYPQKRSIFKFSLSYKNPIIILGRHSLFIYLAHQPLFLAILFIMNKLNLL